MPDTFTAADFADAAPRAGTFTDEDFAEARRPAGRQGAMPAGLGAERPRAGGELTAGPGRFERGLDWLMGQREITPASEAKAQRDAERQAAVLGENLTEADLRQFPAALQKPAAVLGGLGNVARGAAGFFLTPEGVATALTGGALGAGAAAEGGLARGIMAGELTGTAGELQAAAAATRAGQAGQRVVAGGFAAHMTSQLPAQLAQSERTLADPSATLLQQTEAVLGPVVTAAMIRGVSLHAATGAEGRGMDTASGAAAQLFNAAMERPDAARGLFARATAAEAVGRRQEAGVRSQGPERFTARDFEPRAEVRRQETGGRSLPDVAEYPPPLEGQRYEVESGELRVESPPGETPNVQRPTSKVEREVPAGPGAETITGSNAREGAGIPSEADLGEKVRGVQVSSLTGAVESGVTILRDAQGVPTPTATISTIGGKIFSLDSLADWKGKQLRVYGLTEREALDLAREIGFADPVARTDGFGNPRYDLNHPTTAHALEQEKAKAVSENDQNWTRARAGKPVFVRFGKLPEGGRSQNARDGQLEAGVSVYRGWESGGKLFVNWSEVDAISARFIAARSPDVWVVSGREVGKGSDGEPLVVNATARKSKKQIVVLTKETTAPAAAKPVTLMGMLEEAVALLPAKSRADLIAQTTKLYPDFEDQVPALVDRLVADGRVKFAAEVKPAGVTPEQQRIADGTKRIGDTFAPPVIPKPSSGSGVEAFVSSMTPLQAGKAKRSLAKDVRSGGELTSISALVEQRVANGSTIEREVEVDTAARNKLQAEYDRTKGTHPFGNQNHPETVQFNKVKAELAAGGPKVAVRRLVNPDGETFLSERSIGKTAMDYAEHLLSKPETKPAEVRPADLERAIEAERRGTGPLTGPERGELGELRMVQQQRGKLGALNQARLDWLEKRESETKPADVRPAAPREVAQPAAAAAPALQEGMDNLRFRSDPARKTKGITDAKDAKAKLIGELEKAVAQAPELTPEQRKALGNGPRLLMAGDVRNKRITMEWEAGVVQTGLRKVTVEVPGDGTFTVWNTKENLTTLLDKARKLDTSTKAPSGVKTQGTSKEDREWVAQMQAAQGKPFQSWEVRYRDHQNNEHTTTVEARTAFEAEDTVGSTVKGADKIVPGTKVAPPPAAGPEIIGMGGAVKGEFTSGQDSATSIKNATVDLERKERGLPPAMAAGRRGFGDVWDAAMARIDRDPGAPQRLIEELQERPRALTDEEDALLLHRQVELQNTYGRLTRELAQAFEDAREFPSRAADVEEFKLRLAAVSDELLALYDVNKRVGTETGRGLAARRMLAHEDFSLATMELEARVARGGAPLTEADRAEVAKLHERIAATQADFDAYRDKTEAERANRMTDEAIADMQAELKRRPEFDARVWKHAEAFVGKLKAQADKSDVIIREMLARMSSGVDPTLIYHLGVKGAALIAEKGLDFAKFGAEMVGRYSEKVRPHLDAIWAQANLYLEGELAREKATPEVKRTVRKQDDAGRRETIIEGLQRAVQEGAPRGLLGDYARKLVESFVRAGVHDRELLVDKVHEVLTQEAGMELTRRETMDAISGYGSFKALNPDAIKAELRDLKGQMQQVAKLEDIQARVPLQKTGVERRVQSDEERRLIQQVNEAKRQHGVVVTDPARQLKSALDAVRTRLTHQVADLEFQIATKARIVKTKTDAPFDAETKLLEARRDTLKAQLDELVPRPGRTPEQELALAQRTVERSIADYEQRIAGGELTLKARKPGMTSPQLEALRGRRDALKQEWEELRQADPAFAAQAEARALQALKTRMATRTAEYLDRAARGDFEPRVRRTVELDREAQQLQAENLRAKAAFQEALLRERLARRTPLEKAAATLVKWRRGFLLSGIPTLAKLTSAAAQRLAFTPVEELAGAVIGRAFPGVASRAPRQGGANVTAEIKALTEGFTRGMSDAWSQLRRGESDLDALYGHGREGALGERDVEGRSVIDFFGHLHGALKAPVKRAEFARSFEKRAAYAARHGVDVTDPFVQMQLAVEAYKDGQAAIFQQDNRVVSAYKRALSAFEQPDKATGRVSPAARAAATTARVLLPIVRVPTNLVGETFEYALGAVTGSARLARAYRAGVENLKPEEADLILRQLKKGSLGAAVLLLGYFNADVIGGYYQPGEQRDPEDVKAARIRLYGVEVPSLLLHNPLTETLQLGATIRRVADAKLHRRDTEPQGLAAGLAQATLGLAEQVPFVREDLELAKLVDPHTRGRAVGNIVKGVVPKLVGDVARFTDQNAAGETIQRAPTNLLQYVEQEVPGLRSGVPERVDRRRR